MIRTIRYGLLGALTAATLLMTSAASAATFNFVDLATTLGEGSYDPLVVLDGGITLTATGRSLGGTKYYPYLDETDGSGPAGLGVCKAAAGCAGNADDNLTLNELLNLSFSEMVKITSITFRNGAHGTIFDGDAGYAIDDPTASTVGEFTLFDPQSPLALISLSGMSFQFIAGSTFQGLTTETDELRLYISSMTVESASDLGPVPEPGTIGLLGLGLVGLGMRFRRRQK